MHSSSRFRGGVVSGVLAALGLLAAGCGSSLKEQDVDLAGLSGRTLLYTHVDVDLFEGEQAAGSHRVTVTFSQAGGDVCTRLNEGVTATFNGEPMQVERGGVDGTAGRDLCLPTRAFFDYAPDEWAALPPTDARVVFQDGSGTTITVVMKEAQAKRSFDGVSDVQRLLRGQSYSYQWMPSTEKLESAGATLLAEGSAVTATLTTTRDGGRITFTVPPNLGAATHLLTVRGQVQGEVLECTGVTSCSGTYFHSEEQVVSVQ
ncbi:hypothetical protein K8640_05735 [Myxococcus sp. XM-1-1-1]|uniref:hypothetical protein n=1 Tax=Myxococcus sp. XM-1-1-1 TaxID=2874602 RepID=UPI001CBB3B6C|nr:hypothetical protein [Myxococcus sp. XM-1-1-1]MBZ4407703.1 hypothetical protein [Myxococcus sp. XM-1-1-1]